MILKKKKLKLYPLSSNHRQQNECYPQRCYVPISKLHSISVVANIYLPIPTNITDTCYNGQFSLQSATVNYSFSQNLTSLEVTNILL